MLPPHPNPRQSHHHHTPHPANSRIKLAACKLNQARAPKSVTSGVEGHCPHHLEHPYDNELPKLHGGCVYKLLEPKETG